MVSNSSRQRLKTLLIVALAAAFLFSSARINLSHAQTPYYQGKTITIVVGTVAGDLYDLYARAIGMVMGKHIPESQPDRAEHARRRPYDRGKLYLQRC